VNPYEPPQNDEPTTRGWRSFWRWLADHDIIRVQITLVLGCLGIAAAYGIWMHYNLSGNVPASVFAAIGAVGTLSLVAIAEGVWRLDN
jgi:hypothetical protein